MQDRRNTLARTVSLAMHDVMIATPHHGVTGKESLCQCGKRVWPLWSDFIDLQASSSRQLMVVKDLEVLTNG
jgi:bisphosphoglycerate-dependent phosphoglycerate mutase